MAGIDNMLIVRHEIEECIEQKIRSLLEDPMNEYQDPNWVQAAMLFEQAVIPCERYNFHSLYKLAEKILEKAAQNENQAVYQEIPGMYNERLVDPSLVDINKLPGDMRLIKYDKIINNIREWVEKFHLTDY